jgi:hypothetical protein
MKIFSEIVTPYKFVLDFFEFGTENLNKQPTLCTNQMIVMCASNLHRIEPSEKSMGSQKPASVNKWSVLDTVAYPMEESFLLAF